MRYIDADECLDDMRDEMAGTGYQHIAMSVIKYAPTADVVEVKRGHWVEEEACVYACSECGFTFTSADDISEFKYCRCGVKMDGTPKERGGEK